MNAVVNINFNFIYCIIITTTNAIINQSAIFTLATIENIALPYPIDFFAPTAGVFCCLPDPAKLF